ncbi:GNAT family N-acetyltransferase [Candidatus Dojkabacteria bacterium]|nr:GNAT family N-acetyltransferase [Candidatus Dojkabacteria bacterium]
MTDSVKIERLSRKHRQAIRKLMDEFFKDFNRGFLFTDKLRKLEEYKNIDHVIKKELEKYFEWTGFVAIKDNKIVGYIIGHIKEEKQKVLERKGCIEEFFVTENKRGEGVGRLLMNRIIKYFEKKKCDVLAIEAYSVNKKSIDYYRKLGFVDFSMKLVKRIN